MSRIGADQSVLPRTLPVSAERRAAGVLDVEVCDLGWNDAALPPAVLLTYDVDVFDAGAFVNHGIVLPANIARSVRKRQAEFFMGRVAAREALVALERLLHEPASAERFPQGLQIGVGDSREPIWPEGVVGSITHAGRYAASVAAHAPGLRGVGIDIECLLGTETLESVEDTVLQPSEKALLHALAGEMSYAMLLTIVFSAKESFFKGTFATVGSYFEFDAVSVTALDPVEGTLDIVLNRSLAPELPHGRPFSLRFQRIDAGTFITSFVW